MFNAYILHAHNLRGVPEIAILPESFSFSGPAKQNVGMSALFVGEKCSHIRNC